MVKVSVVLPVFRPGGLDITFMSLRDQTFRDFELILIDRRYEKRRTEVKELARQLNVATVHAPEHRRNGKWAVLCAAWNTGYMLAQGEIVLMPPDFTYLPPTWIENHLRHHKNGNRMVLSPYTMLVMPPVVDKKGKHVDVPSPDLASSLPNSVTDQPPDYYDEISIFEDFFHPSLIPDLERWPDNLQCPRLVGNWTSRMETHIHFRNESIPLGFLLDINGQDENLDKGKCQIDLEFGSRARRNGCEFVADLDNMVYMLNPRSLFPTAPQHGYEDTRWGYKACEAYKKECDLKRTLVAAHPCSLKEKREEILSWRELEVIPTDNLDIPDKSYYP